MIGQEHLVKQLSEYSIDTLPHSILLVGEQGSGKHSVVELIASTFNLRLVDLTKNITAEDCVDISLELDRCAYVVDCDAINNLYKVLKILEEPNLNTYFILYTVDANYVSSTIRDRCVEFKMKPYSYTELAQFNTTNLPEISYNIARTPGQILRLDTSKIGTITNLVDTIISSMHRASLANALTIATKFNYKAEEYSGIDIDLFLNYFEFKAVNTVFMNSIIKYKKDLLNPRYSRKDVMESFIIDMWEVVHEFSRA